MHNWKQALSGARQGESKYKTLVQAITADIEQGRLSDGQRLPPQRQVSEALGISVQTVTNAYKELERQGRVRCEVGRGSFVSRRTSEKVATSMLDRSEQALLDFSIARIVHTGEHDRLWQATCGELATEPDQPWIRAFRPIAGFESHREAGVRWLSGLGLEVTRDDLLLTNGAAHGIFLALASLAGPDDVVLCEGLSDHGVIGSSQVLGFTLKGLEMDAHGIDPEHFEDMCGNERITALVCTPNLNNPTSCLMPDARRREIAEIARRYGVYVIEDDVYGPLLAGQQRARPISHYLPELSFYCTSMTKSVLAGLRLGYLAMPKRLALRTESILRVNSWMATPLLGEIAARWINGGQAEELVQMQRQLLANRQALVEAELGEFLLRNHPYSLNAWLAVPEHWAPDNLLRELRRKHVALTLPDPFVPPGMPRPRAVRLCVGAECSEAQMHKGLGIIREVFGQYPKIHDF
ncbi:MocR-like ectoine utilization transcription factor EhuR [Phytopseudomonas dryadis]|uniref:GntR family transcriptional regulator n=1 Tax=Phytopseudomonas dryadis TaxID=2487520 RepID=A0A4Q9QVE0_9GAMM|nr:MULTISPECIES: PLP-dependent aminotransferase family protein [Pseudomonas]TBU87777.1 GntR family transcriptional regulator [Pseudomonas dryadis]TBV00212.1 GntR family transcriptional regulator [Pseudomonas dryadis]TBV14454.1 GntR family transcriptional regulator [Pseudomonas sp. FRB 230]